MFTGTVKKTVLDDLGDLEFEETDDNIICTLDIAGEVVVKFPVEKSSDVNDLARIMGVVINQTGLVSNPVHVEVTEVPDP